MMSNSPQSERNYHGSFNKQDWNGARSFGRRVATLRAALKEEEGTL